MSISEQPMSIPTGTWQVGPLVGRVRVRAPRPAGGTMTELDQLVRQLRELVSRRDELRARSGAGSDLEEAEGALEQLRWRLAHVARHRANDELGNAA